MSDFDDNLKVLRDEIDDIDSQLVKLLAQRLTVTTKVGELKSAEGMPIFAPEREAALISKRREQAEKWGMIWRCVDDEDLIKETSALAHTFANKATTGLGFTKQLLRLSQSRTLDEQLDLERDYQQAASQTQDFAEGVDAFLNKRKPVFTGR